MDNNKTCEHIWRMNGSWNGKTPDGLPTGGVMYKCDKCGEKASTIEKIKELGGTFIENTDIYGNPK